MLFVFNLKYHVFLGRYVTLTFRMIEEEYIGYCHKVSNNFIADNLVDMHTTSNIYVTEAYIYDWFKK